MSEKPFLGTKINKNAMIAFESVYKLCKSIADETPTFQMHVQEPINLRPDAYVALLIPHPAGFCSVEVRNVMSLLFKAATDVVVTGAENATVMTFCVNNIWEE